MGFHGMHGKIDCCGCCECKPKEIARKTIVVNGTGEYWDLTEYQKDDAVKNICKGKGFWRLTNNYESYVPRQKGCVDGNGKLLGLPSSISPTSYKYTWVFILELGCLTKDGKQIEWPKNPERPNGEKSEVFECSEKNNGGTRAE